MKITRYQDPSDRILLAAQNAAGDFFELDGELFSTLSISTRPAQIEKVLAPLVPSTILGIGVNFKEAVAKTGAKVTEYPVVFYKLLNTLQNPGDPIMLPAKLKSELADYEGELAVVIGKDGKNISREDAMDYVFGYTVVNDISGRDWQNERVGNQWSKGKSFDTFCPLGPVLVTKDEIPDPTKLQIRTYLNDKLVQDAQVSDLISDISTIIEFLSAGMTVPAGSIILTGTPYGCGIHQTPVRCLKDGDTVAVEIEGIGRLENPVVDEKI